MAISFLALSAYQKSNRIIVQYYHSGEDENCLCPECGWRGELPTDSLRDICCTEVICPSCATALAMISSRLPNDGHGLRCI